MIIPIWCSKPSRINKISKFLAAALRCDDIDTYNTLTFSCVISFQARLNTTSQSSVNNTNSNRKTSEDSNTCGKSHSPPLVSELLCILKCSWSFKCPLIFRRHRAEEQEELLQTCCLLDEEEAAVFPPLNPVQPVAFRSQLGSKWSPPS